MPTIIRNGRTYGGGGGSGNASNKYSTEEQVIGTWIDGSPIYRIVSSEPIDFNQNSSEFQELIGDTRNFSGGSTRWSTITADYVEIWAQDIGNNYVDICVPIPTSKAIYLTRELVTGTKLSGFQYWIGTTLGGSDIAVINVPRDDYFKEICTDEIILSGYRDKYDEAYIRIVLGAVAGNDTKYRYTSISYYMQELKPEYSYVLKANDQLGIKETGFMYCSEYTKSNA